MRGPDVDMAVVACHAPLNVQKDPIRKIGRRWFRRDPMTGYASRLGA